MFEQPDREDRDEEAPPQAPEPDQDPIEDEELRQRVDDAEQGLREQTQGH